MSPRATNLPSDAEDEEWDQALETILDAYDDEPEPRQQHYGFAHMVLPSIFLGNPRAVLHKLIREGDLWVRQVWEECGSRVPAEGRVVGASPTVRVVQGEGFSVALITMPPPLSSTEAYYLACVEGVKRKWLLFPMRTHRYFTLEKSMEGAFVGEWAAVGQHRLYDDDDIPISDAAFLEWVSRHW
jgi:hypothetical protein